VLLRNRRIVEMTNGEATKVRAWISAFRARRIDREGLERRLIGSGYAEPEAQRFAELLAATAG
jgi:hypothetical protein